jgi:crotonobetainyl-CoA:carnitine CoA-transferase CaiB-like acyl-CoA transferase
VSTEFTTHGAATPGDHLDPAKPHALKHITVIDFTQVLAGPTCTRMLADAGARVIKIERPGTGDDSRQMGPVLKADAAAAWHERLEDAGIPVSLVLNVDDTRKLEQIKMRGMVKDVGGFGVPGNPVKFGAYNSLGATIPSPELNNAGDALRAEFGPSMAGPSVVSTAEVGTADSRREPASAPRPRSAPSDQQDALKDR